MTDDDLQDLFVRADAAIREAKRLAEMNEELRRLAHFRPKREIQYPHDMT